MSPFARNSLPFYYCDPSISLVFFPSISWLLTLGMFPLFSAVSSAQSEMVAVNVIHLDSVHHWLLFLVIYIVIYHPLLVMMMWSYWKTIFTPVMSPPKEVVVLSFFNSLFAFLNTLGTNCLIITYHFSLCCSVCNLWHMTDYTNDSKTLKPMEQDLCFITPVTGLEHWILRVSLQSYHAFVINGMCQKAKYL